MLVKHGHSTRNGKSPEYRTWQAMMSRCHNENDHNYANYGGRGIVVCRRWWKFELFLEDMGERPSDEHRLGRRNVNRAYSPANCMWTTLAESMNNRTDNTFVRWRGQRKTIAQWARELDINPKTLSSRLRRGWTISRALSE